MMSDSSRTFWEEWRARVHAEAAAALGMDVEEVGALVDYCQLPQVPIVVREALVLAHYLSYEKRLVQLGGVPASTECLANRYTDSLDGSDAIQPSLRKPYRFANAAVASHAVATIIAEDVQRRAEAVEAQSLRGKMRATFVTAARRRTERKPAAGTYASLMGEGWYLPDPFFVFTRPGRFGGPSHEAGAFRDLSAADRATMLEQLIGEFPEFAEKRSVIAELWDWRVTQVFS